jgi:hypothetical protein
MKNIAKIIETQYELNYVIPIIGEMIDKFFEDYLNELNKSRDNKNEYDGLKILEVEFLKHELLDRPGNRSSAKHYEDNRSAHAGSLVKLLGYTEEGTNTCGLLKNVVISKYAYEQNVN